MYQSHQQLKASPYKSVPWSFYTEELSVCTLDLETTGLHSKHDSVILGGLLSTTSMEITQSLCEHSSEEFSLLKTIYQNLCEFDLCLTYNGDTFDFPFLLNRFKKYGIAEELPFFQSIDLYRIFRHYSPMAKLLPNLRQKTVEEFLGLQSSRRDELSGADSVKLFELYSNSGDMKLRELILLHNRDDLTQLSLLMKMLDKMDLHQIMNENGFLLKQKEKKIYIRRIAIQKKQLIIEGDTKGIDADFDSFHESSHISHNLKTCTLAVSLPLLSVSNCFVVDLDPLEGDFSPLFDDPHYESGYLVLHDGNHPYYRTLNHFVKILLTNALSHLGTCR